jgi:hypothetical protein
VCAFEEHILPVDGCPVIARYDEVVTKREQREAAEILERLAQVLADGEDLRPPGSLGACKALRRPFVCSPAGGAIQSGVWVRSTVVTCRTAGSPSLLGRKRGWPYNRTGFDQMRRSAWA